MLFSSIPFLYYFLPAVLIVYFAVPKRIKNAVLLLSSLIFYGWGEPKYVILMIATIAAFYFCGLGIGRAKSRKTQKIWLTVSVVIGIALLTVFKYADFFLQSFAAVTGLSIPLLKLALPIGISFYTFQCMSYVVDVYRGTAAPQKNIVTFGAYVALFPQLIAGPIVRYVDVARELENRETTMEDAMTGIRRFLIGLGKKILLANQLGLLTEVFRASNEKSVLFHWLYAVAFMLHIYFDFSGYSDMAIGLGRIFGFHFIENFNYPYLSKSVTEFWRRWHMSLGSWFRDYVYIPLGGNRVSKSRWVFNIMVVWMLTGLWHGASWNFVLWGAYYGALLILEKSFLLKWLKKMPQALGHIYTLVAVALGWALFYFEDMGSLGSFLTRLFTPASSAAASELMLGYLPFTLAAMFASLPLAKIWAEKQEETVLWRYGRILAAAMVMLLCVAALASQSYNPFIYFRF